MQIHKGTTAVLGLGNVLMGDDAAGPHVIARLIARFEMPEDVQLVDLGTPGLDLVPFVSDHTAVIVVDTTRATDPPGTVKVYDRDGILTHQVTARVSPHDPGLKEAILSTEFARQEKLDVVVVGVVPADTEQTIGLGPEVTAALPALEDAVLAELGKRGHQVQPRTRPDAPDLWWEAGLPSHPAER